MARIVGDATRPKIYAAATEQKQKPSDGGGSDEAKGGEGSYLCNYAW